VHNLDLIDALAKLTTDENAKTRKNAASALGNIATVDGNKEILIKHGNGSLICALLKVVCGDIEGGARRRAMRTLRCVASGNVIDLVRNHGNFVDSIIRVSIEDSDRDTRIQATETLATMISEVSCSSNNGSDMIRVQLMRGIVQNIAENRDKKCAEITCKTLSQEFSKMESGGHRVNISDFPRLLQALEEVTLDNSHSYDVKHCAAKILHNLATFDENIEIMVCKSVMDTLAAIASLSGPNTEKAPEYAIQTIIRLSQVEQNRRQMAEHENLLTALVNFTVAAPEGSLKDEAKRTILLLVPIL